MGTPVPAGSLAQSTGVPLAVRAMLAGLKLINYYPAQHHWDAMWTAWDPATIDRDFARIAALHANAVRIIVQANTFGYPAPRPVMLGRLAQSVELAAKHGLRVQLTLFDWWDDYADIAGSRQWAAAVLRPYAGDPRVAFVELQNEMDPSSIAAMTWARQMLVFVRGLVPGTPITVSVPDVVGMAKLRALLAALQGAPLDFADLHYYGAAALAPTALAQAIRTAAPLPLFIGETGFSTSLSNSGVDGLPGTAPAHEAYQDYYLRSVQHAARGLGLPLAATWTLNDFPAGSLNWVPPNSIEYGFGLYHVDGSAKPAATALAAILAGGHIDTGIDNGFESCTAGSTPPQWLLFHASEGQFACDMAVSHSGFASARISRSTGDRTGVPAFYESPIVGTLVPGETYTATVWARGERLTGLTVIAIAWFAADNTYLGGTTSAPLPPGTTPWTLLTASSTPPAGAAFVQIHLKSAYNTGTAWFDDVTFH
jgi:hypothetical protein